MNRKTKNISLAFIFALLAFITVFIMARTGRIYDGDYRFHYLRILAIRHCLTTLSYDTGVTHRVTMIFYPWLTFVPLALLSFVIHSPVTLFYIASFIIIFLQYALSYWGYQLIHKSTPQGLLFSAMYVNSIAMFNNLFTSGGLPSALCLAFLPLVFFGTLSHRWKILGISLLFISFTHIPTTILATLMIICLIAIDFRRLSKSDVKHVCLIISSIFALTSIYWLPMIYELMTHDIQMPISYKPWTSGLGNAIFTNLGIIFGILICLSAWKAMSRSDKILCYLALPVLLLNLAFVSHIVLTVLPVLKVFQFTMRFNFFIALMGSYLTAKYMKIDKKWIYGLAILTVLVPIGSSVSTANYMQTMPILFHHDAKETYHHYVLTDHSFKVLKQKHNYYNKDYLIK